MGPLRHGDFRLLWSGWIISTTGVWLYQVVNLWLILELTDSPLMLGVNGVFRAVPFLITSLYGGALADRMDRRKMLVISQALLVCFAATPALLLAFDLLNVWHLYGLSFLISMVGGFESPARQALVSAFVPRRELMQATALTSSIYRSTALIGPTIGGFGIACLEPAGTFLVYALFNGTALLLYYLMKEPAVTRVITSQSVGSSILEGVAYVIENRVVWGLLSLAAVHTFLVTSQTLMPVFARDILDVGPTGLGLLYSASGLGSLLSSGLALAMGDVRKKGRLLFVSDFSKPMALVLFAGSSWLPVSMILLVYAGLFDMVGQIVRTTILQLMPDDATRGRVMSINMMVQRGLGPLSGLQSGALASLVGAPAALVTGAALFVLYGIFLFFRVPEVYSYRQDPVR